ncbi:hypothetical protein A4A49_29299 [Nicotiana attenuata]|uniref:Uncharacterized protein n=1 Tax=Nicotiana attenuata TaxID=49451 RepID=A0A314L5J1_NICAT|nr:hypothetical protein A4A49_29299 [Nicotiana attenuata]
MGDSSSQYIHMVHHLIEECLLFNMSREECMKALSKHANIQPVITSTGKFDPTFTSLTSFFLSFAYFYLCYSNSLKILSNLSDLLRVVQFLDDLTDIRQ